MSWVGIANRTPAKAQALAEEFAIPESGSDVAAMIDALHPDFVDICTSVETHFDFVKIAADRGVPILCQKPLAPTFEASRQIVAYCAARAVPLMVNENWRWQAWHREIKTILRSGRLGKINNVLFRMRSGDGFGPDAYAQQPYFREMKRFLLLETGIHYIDTIRFLFGEPTGLACSTWRRNPHIRGEDACLLRLDFPDELTVVWDADRTAHTETVRPPANGTLFIEGSAGNLALEPDGRIRLSTRNGESLVHDYSIPAGYRGGSTIGAQRHFITQLQAGQPFETSGEAYLKTVALVFAAYASAESESSQPLPGHVSQT